MANKWPVSQMMIYLGDAVRMEKNGRNSVIDCGAWEAYGNCF
jgi:hypothetical protein